MDVTLRTNPSILCRQNTHLNIRPFTGLPFCRTSTQACSWRIHYRANGGFGPFCATGEFSRKRQKKRSTRRSKGRTSIGFVPKAPAERGSQKRDQWNSEDNRTSVIPPELDSRTPDARYSSKGVDREIVEVSQVKRFEGGINGRARDSSPTNKRKTGKNLSKDKQTVKRFTGRGESSSGKVFHESELDVEEGNSTMDLYRSIGANEVSGESKISGSKIHSPVNTTSDKSYQKTQADNYVNGSEVLITETRSSETTSDEKEVNDLVSPPKNVDNGCIKSDEILTETEQLEPQTMAHDALVCNEKKVTDLVSVNTQENLALVNYKSMECYESAGEAESLASEAMGHDIKSDKSADETKIVGSGTTSSDTPTYPVKEVHDVVIVQENLDLITYENIEPHKNADETEVLGSDLVDSSAIIIDENELKDFIIIEVNQDLVNESAESGLSGSKTVRSSSMISGVRVKDLVVRKENLALVRCGSVESSDIVSAGREQVALKSFDSDKNVSEARALKSETMDSDNFTSVKEDSVSIQGNTALVDESISETNVVGSETKDTEASDAKELEESLQKLDLEMDSFTHKQMLADENFSKGNRMFIYPGVVKPALNIEVFYNRSLSSLQNEPDVVIKGAFNDWSWRSFTLKLNKSHLRGDWWACNIHVPKQAYAIDFVFYNGKNTYDNNNGNDYHITVEGGMDRSAFEDFLLEDKQRELERLAKEQAERERQAVEQSKREEQRAASAADLTQAKLEVERKKEKMRVLINKSVPSADDLCYFRPSQFKGGDLVRLYYNKISGPLAQAKDIWIHGGHNGWEDGLSIVSKLIKSEEEDARWWRAEVTVPDQAVVLDWVFANGPPQSASVYDNNKKQDFHAIVPGSIRDEQYWAEEEHRIFQRLQEERRAREEAIRSKAEKTARMKAEKKEHTLKAFLLSQRHIIYTDPAEVQAGCDVTVYYNPSNTVLNGKPEVWFRCSFNRWAYHRGPLPPQKMLPDENGSHLKTIVKVPLDAYIMDFVFSEREDGGVFDNRNDMDYHVPVFGGIANAPPMHIVHIAVEMAPIAKVGGLGDVVTSLSRAVQDLNHHVNIVFPKYDCLNQNHVKDLHYQKCFAWGGTEIKVWFGKVEGLSVYFLEPLNGFFSTGNIYAGLNDGARFGFFCHAALEFLVQMGFHPDIIHCHDWTSAPVAWLFKEHYIRSAISNARVVFTIHNLEFGAIFIGKAMAHADKATTVSGTYSKEVAGNPAISPHLHKFHGILNGIDPDIWDPYNDKFIPVSYTSENVVEGKKAAKELLQQRLSLKKADLPLIGIISRLTHQKGIHLIKHAIWHTLERGGQVVLLGSAPDPRIHSDFVNLMNQMHNLHCDRARLCLTYDEPLSHLIYAGADFILVPSIFEPCGLTQLVAMRYGSIPVVRKTGGLYDTVFDVDHEQERAKAHGLEPNGFNFDGADPAGVNYALDRAISAWYDGKEWLNYLRKRVMEQDWSWNRPALEYIELYHAAHKY